MKLPNPLETVFNMGPDEIEIDDKYEMMEAPLQATISEPVPDNKDADDILVEKRIDEIYDVAMETFNNQTAMLEIVEPRYAARNAEVAANYLNIALAAVNSRAKVKSDRKKTNQGFVPYNNGSKTTNNLIVASRNDILRMMTLDNVPKEI
jgi:hypothetical protein